MSRQPLVVCVVLNLNRRTDTLECLESIAAGSYGTIRAIVLDAGSSDGSVQAVRASFPQTQVIELTQNLGYAGNNNTGIRAALDQGADWVFVLAEDVVLDHECLARLVEVAEGDPSIGIVGPMVYHHDEPGVIQSAGGRLSARCVAWHLGQNEPDRGQFREPHHVEWISGCAILVRRSVIDEVGMLDPRFFYYCEETEWCVRARKAGWRIVQVPGAGIWHKGVQRDYRPKPSVTHHATRNRLLMLSKHHAPLAARGTAWLEILRTLTSWSVRPKWRAKREHRDAMWRGILDYLHGRWGQMPGC